MKKPNDDGKKEIGRWKYIKFADVLETTAGTSRDENSETFTLPRIKHSVLEDKKNGGKYVMIGEESKQKSKLGKPYRTGRSLVIRSRLKNSQSISPKQSGPFTVVKAPKRADKSCVPLRLALSKNNWKSRGNYDLKSSEKFWLQSETRSEASNNQATTRIDKPHINRSLTTNNSSSDAENVIDSGTSIGDERTVEVHEYSTVQPCAMPPYENLREVREV